MIDIKSEKIDILMARLMQTKDALNALFDNSFNTVYAGDNLILTSNQKRALEWAIRADIELEYGICFYKEAIRELEDD